MIFIIDRIDEGIAICETANGNSFPVPAALLGDVSEGDCIDVCPKGNIRITAIDDGYMTVKYGGIYTTLPVAEGMAVGDGFSFIIDDEEKEARKNMIETLSEELFE